jgi:hypothetical protein
MNHRTNTKDRRGAALYIVVLACALVVGAIGLGTLQVVRIERRETSLAHDVAQARAHARSAVELGLRRMELLGTWRLLYANGVATSPEMLGTGDGSVGFAISDSDGSLIDSDTQLRLTGVGRLGEAVQVLSVEIEAEPTPLDVLQKAVYSVGNMSASASVNAIGAPFATAGGYTNGSTTNGSIEAYSVTNATGTINGNVWAPTINSGGSILGTIDQTAVPIRTMPKSDVFDATYAPLATTIPYASIAGATINRMLLTTTNNPWGLLNALGIYRIDVPDGATLTIRQSRINACLLVSLGANATLTLSNANLLHTPSASYPVLIVKGQTGSTVDLNGFSNPLSESSTDTNFNPLLSPYNGVSNLTKNDSYPSEIRGLVHVIGAGTTTNMGSNCNVVGVVITEGSCMLGSNARINFDPSIYTNRPNGYTDLNGPPRAVMGTWLDEPAF